MLAGTNLIIQLVRRLSTSFFKMGIRQFPFSNADIDIHYHYFSLFFTLCTCRKISQVYSLIFRQAIIALHAASIVLEALHPLSHISYKLKEGYAP